MKKLYDKDPLTFFMIWMGLYLITQVFANSYSAEIGVEWSVTAAANVVLSILLFGWLWFHGLLGEMGLCRSKAPARAMLFFLPLAVISSNNLWNGVAVKLSGLPLICCIISMISVGFLEELLMRGILFRYLRRDGVKDAVLFSAGTFAVAHFFNMFKGDGMVLVDNVLQVACAFALGVLYAVILLRTGSLWPCILSHSAIDVLSVFLREEGMSTNLHVVLTCLNMAIMGLYLYYLVKTFPEDERKALKEEDERKTAEVAARLEEKYRDR